MVKRMHSLRAVILGAAVLSLTACDSEVLLWPWVEPSDQEPPPPPPPPLEPVNPILSDDAPPSEDAPATDAPENVEPPAEGLDETDEAVDPDASAPPDPDVADPDVVDPATPETPTTPETPEAPPAETATPAFFYHAPGDLEPDSGEGARDDTIYVPDMVFPIKDAPAFPQSQVYRFGGGVIGGDQCDARNFDAPWRDNYCEARTRDNGTPYCPANRVHLGQDIRVGTPAGCDSERRLSSVDRKRYAVVAAEDGVISNVGRYTVNVRAGGRIYRYMHMNMSALEVGLGDTVIAGQTLGYVSNDFGGTPTTLHLHFEIKHNTVEHGWTWAPPFMSLVRAYERREGAPGALISGETPVLVASD